MTEHPPHGRQLCVAFPLAISLLPGGGSYQPHFASKETEAWKDSNNLIFEVVSRGTGIVNPCSLHNISSLLGIRTSRSSQARNLALCPSLSLFPSLLPFGFWSKGVGGAMPGATVA